MLTDIAPEVSSGGSPQANGAPMSNDESRALVAYNIPDSRIANLETKVARLARRAQKLGMAKVELVKVKAGPRMQQRRDPDSGKLETYELSCTWCELRGPAPVLSGYTFLARLEHTDLGNLVSRVAGAGDEIDLTAYRTADPHCDHCKHKRTRKDTFVLRTPEGGLVQIGRNCLADYLRSANADVVLAMLQLTNELADSVGEDDDEWGEGGFGGGYRLITLVDDYIAAAVVAVREFGWVSRGAVQKGLPKTATADNAAFIAGKCPSDRRAAEEWRRLQPTAADKERAEKILAWIKESTDASDYMHNLRIAVGQSTVNYRTTGLLASAPNAYAREVEKQIAQRTERKESKHVGQKGERRLFKGLRLVRKPVIDTEWGGLAIHIFEDGDGNVFVWKTGTGDLELDRVYDVKGTVKEHTDYKGRPQTELSRCVASFSTK
jgi:hypothetical protein